MSILNFKYVGDLFHRAKANLMKNLLEPNLPQSLLKVHEIHK